MATATYLRDMAGFRGHASLYRLDPPATVNDWATGSEEIRTTEYVVVSAVDVPFSGPETYIFPANADGEVTDWGEMEGSFRGALDHQRALLDAGYSIESNPST